MVRPLFFVAVAAAASWGALVACNVSVATPDSTAGHPTVDGSYSPTVADGGMSEDAAPSNGYGYGDASAPNLCHLSSSSICDPDEPATSESCRVAPDGGTYDPNAGTGQTPMSCHVPPASPNTSASAPPPNVCLPAGSGMDGAPCKQSADCAPRYECVLQGTDVTAKCRKYCCAGDGACSAQQFCDVQPMAAASTTTVPVCMTISPVGGCDLLADGGCPSMQTCAVVSETGATSCVDVGPVAAGGDCDEQHCAANLVCLGAPGQRACYQLCHTNATPNECPSSKPTCKGGLPLFPDPDDGICQ